MALISFNIVIINIILLFIFYKYLYNSYYNLLNDKFKANYKSQYSQDIIMYFKYFNNITNGFFIEIGAFDGVSISNTYLLEKNLNWKGILIEGGNRNCKKMYNNSERRKQSKLICSPICKSDYVYYKDYGTRGKIRDNNKSAAMIKCNTLSNITDFFNIKHIDFFSLDVEGSELEVLETFDFRVKVSYWMIEWPNLNAHIKNKIKYLLKKNGYIMKNEYISPVDVLFSHI